MEDEQKKTYRSPFCSRYASEEMQQLFSENKKYSTWRKLWVALARAENELGLNVSKEQVKELEENVNNIDYDIAQKQEKIVKHDVMAHIYAYEKQCKKSGGIIHLGATSCYVVDNADIIIMKEALMLVKRKLLAVIRNLSIFAKKYSNLPCLAYTHLQPAQPTTIGKRATLWLNDFCVDYKQLQNLIEDLKLLGCKGTTGTQASFLKLFDGDELKVKELEKKIVNEMGFLESVPVSGQTYSRKTDFRIAFVISSIAESAMKFSGDIRLLQSFKEIEEPFEENQVGSSAMPYKRNPMKCERITALSRYVLVNILNPAFTAGVQWLERSLDDSANKRIVLPEMFLGADSILNLLINVTSNIKVFENTVRKRLLEELPFMATENIMMAAVKKGESRQKIHEKLRKYSILAANKIKQDGKDNELVEMLSNDENFDLNEKDFKEVLKPENFVGLSCSQVESFLKDIVEPLFKENKINLETKFDLSV